MYRGPVRLIPSFAYVSFQYTYVGEIIYIMAWIQGRPSIRFKLREKTNECDGVGLEFRFVVLGIIVLATGICN